MKIINLECFKNHYKSIFKSLFDEKALHEWEYYLRTKLRKKPIEKEEIFYIDYNIYHNEINYIENTSFNHVEKILFKFKMTKHYTIEYLNYQ